jgi:type IV pilus assembly protein PilN
VILINLLPHREARRKRQRELFFASLGAAVFVGGVVLGFGYLALQAMIANQQSRNAILKAEITRLDGQIKDIATLRSEIDGLRARQQAVEDLQADRNQPVFLLDEMAKQLPEGAYITLLKQEGQVVTINGFAQSQERVSEVLRIFANNSEWLERPELLFIRASNLTIGKDAKRLAEFQMRVSLKRPRDKDAQKPSAPGATPSAVKKS